MKIGCHVSIAGGVQNSPERASSLGCEVMQIFTRSPQGGKAPELTVEIIKDFEKQRADFKISDVFVHTPYYINFSSQNNRIRYGSVSVLREELERASILRAKYVMTHLGSSGELPLKQALKKTSEMISKSLEGYDGEAELLLENSAGAGKILGSNFSELKSIIDEVSHPKLAGICLDTQHSFASGYNWNDFKKATSKIDSEIGLEKIKLFHINDSEVTLGSNKDRHAHIGEGEIKEVSFSKIIDLACKYDIDAILETKHDKVQDDLKKLKEFRK